VALWQTGRCSGATTGAPKDVTLRLLAALGFPPDITKKGAPINVGARGGPPRDAGPALRPGKSLGNWRGSGCPSSVSGTSLLEVPVSMPIPLHSRWAARF